MCWGTTRIIISSRLNSKLLEGKKSDFHHTKLRGIRLILRIPSSYFGPLVRGPRNLFRTACTVVQESRSLLLAACRLRLAAWGLDLRLNYSSRLVLDAWCLWLVAWSSDLDPMTKFRRPFRVTICPAPFIVQPGDDVVVFSMSWHTSPHNNHPALNCLWRAQSRGHSPNSLRPLSYIDLPK